MTIDRISLRGRSLFARAFNRSASEPSSQVRRSPGASCPVDDFHPAPGRDVRTWWRGRPLSEARNAHRTNTTAELAAALNSSANWLEGDVRREIDGSGIEMRHDREHESGNNLSLRDWLEAGRASEKGLKLDVKEADQMPAILDELEGARIPPERLMLNLSFSSMEKWGPKVRERFLNVVLAINPPTSGMVDAAAARQMVAQAEALGGPVTFVVRHDRLSDAAIREFQTHGGVSVWGHAEDPAAVGGSLRARGVDGVIDVEAPARIDAKTVLDKGRNWLRTQLDRL